MSKSSRPTRAMLAAIGEVAAESARVEDLMRELFSMLIDSPYGAVICAGEDLSRICQMCARVAQYNLALTDEQVEQLGTIINAIDALRDERNYFVHSRWEYVPSVRRHIGVRSQRPSPRPNGGDVDTLYYCTPDDALEIAVGFRTVAAGIERYSEQTFPNWARQRLPRRANWKKMNAFTERMLHSFFAKEPPSVV
ncbi:hypothetical protein RWH44_11125 [Microbacterium sp. KSW2-29]|uniref:HEPN AbiU2-like domain-containing protein n=1 Tax=Microbacterium phycohabitans TaxID=3075993 RepID=A0ABU3SNK8_9MICO|nr:hypothetical protein [Microbacterium sp. KSW2-29]MDU0346251.1 hypothetical protein [Microbacterium sp. KSW2-29]